MRCHHRQERTVAAADVTPVRANRVAGQAVELQAKPRGGGSRPQSNSVMFGEWRHEMHGVIEGCSNRLVVTISHKARVVWEWAFC